MPQMSNIPICLLRSYLSLPVYHSNSTPQSSSVFCSFSGHYISLRSSPLASRCKSSLVA
jgi:hypothetical protein